MIRKILGVLAGAVVAVLAIMAGQFALHAAVPMPAIDMKDAEAVKTMMASAPMAGMLGLAAVYLIAALIGGFVAGKIARVAWAGWVVTALLLAATVMNVMAIPHPTWLVVLFFVVIAGGGWFGSRAGAKA